MYCDWMRQEACLPFLSHGGMCNIVLTGSALREPPRWPSG